MSDPRMPPPALAERRQAATQLEIAEAAASLFIESGFDGTTVERIAVAAGISLRTFYRYCSAKDDVLTAVVTASVHEFVEGIALQSASLSVSEAVAASLLECVENDIHATTRKRLARVMLTTPSLRFRWLGATREAQDILVPLLAARTGQSPNSLSTITLAGLVLNAVTTALEHSVLNDEPLNDCLTLSLRVLRSDPG